MDETSKAEIKQALQQYDRTLLVSDPRRCEPKKCAFQICVQTVAAIDTDVLCSIIQHCRGCTSSSQCCAQELKTAPRDSVIGYERLMQFQFLHITVQLCAHVCLTHMCPRAGLAVAVHVHASRSLTGECRCCAGRACRLVQQHSGSSGSALCRGRCALGRTAMGR